MNDEAQREAEVAVIAAIQGVQRGLDQSDACVMLIEACGTEALAAAGVFRYTATALRLFAICAGGPLNLSTWTTLLTASGHTVDEQTLAILALAAQEAGGLQVSDWAAIPASPSRLLAETIQLAAIVIWWLRQLGAPLDGTVEALRIATFERTNPSLKTAQRIIAKLIVD